MKLTADTGAARSIIRAGLAEEIRQEQDTGMSAYQRLEALNSVKFRGVVLGSSDLSVEDVQLADLHFDGFKLDTPSDQLADVSARPRMITSE